MNEHDLRHILEFLSPATLAGMLNDWASYTEDSRIGSLPMTETPTPQQRQVMALVRDVLVANVGEQDADAMIEAVGRMR